MAKESTTPQNPVNPVHPVKKTREEFYRIGGFTSLPIFYLSARNGVRSCFLILQQLHFPNVINYNPTLHNFKPLSNAGI